MFNNPVQPYKSAIVLIHAHTRFPPAKNSVPIALALENIMRQS